ncbi:MAG: hypothetical protein ACW98F_13325 [Candidatus Hodarchaeales archaeon]|jgi:hypothetical protein
MNRFDSIPKNEFIEYMEFPTNKEFLEWLSELPDDLPIRIKNDVVHFK